MTFVASTRRHAWTRRLHHITQTRIHMAGVPIYQPLQRRNIFV